MVMGLWSSIGGTKVPEIDAVVKISPELRFTTYRCLGAEPTTKSITPSAVALPIGGNPTGHSGSHIEARSTHKLEGRS
jgi:hypothetical protein